MPKGGVRQEVQNQKCREKYDKFRHISNDLKRLKERPESRRGPFIISDDDLNDQFDLQKNVLCD